MKLTKSELIKEMKEFTEARWVAFWNQLYDKGIKVDADDVLELLEEVEQDANEDKFNDK